MPRKGPSRIADGATTNSQCGGWAELMVATLQAHGFGNVEMWAIHPDPFVLPQDSDDDPDNGVGLKDSWVGFLVKNYNFVGQGTSGSFSYPYMFNDPCITAGAFRGVGVSNWPGPSEVNDLDGTPAQDVTNPASRFTLHVIVRLTNLGKWYDPSYGTGPASGESLDAVHKWEDGGDGFPGALAGFYRALLFPGQNARPVVRANSPEREATITRIF